MKNDTYTKYAPKLTQHSKFTNIPNTTENLKTKKKKTEGQKIKCKNYLQLNTVYQIGKKIITKHPHHLIS